MDLILSIKSEIYEQPILKSSTILYNKKNHFMQNIDNNDNSDETNKIISNIESKNDNKWSQQDDSYFTGIEEQILRQQKLLNIKSQQLLEQQQQNQIEDELNNSPIGKQQQLISIQSPQFLNGRVLKIAEIKSYYQNWQLMGKIAQKSSIKYYKINQRTFNFVIEDSNSDQINIICENQVCDKFFDSVELEKYYIISGMFEIDQNRFQSNISKSWYLDSDSSIRAIEINQTQQTNAMELFEIFLQAIQTNTFQIPQINDIPQKIKLTPLFFTRPQDQIKYESYIDNTKETLFICMYSLRELNLINSLEYLSNMSNIKIKIIVDQTQSEHYGQIKTLNRLCQSQNIEIRLISFNSQKASMHNKIVIIDSKITMTGSLNWSQTAFQENDENVIIIEDEKIALEYTAQCNIIWKRGIPYRESPNNTVIDMKGITCLIADLTSSEKNFCIIGKVTEKAEQQKSQKDNDNYEFCFILEDENKDRIELHCKGDAWDKFFNLVEEEKFYSIKGIFAPHQKKMNGLRKAYLHKQYAAIKEIKTSKEYKQSRKMKEMCKQQAQAQSSDNFIYSENQDMSINDSNEIEQDITTESVQQKTQPQLARVVFDQPQQLIFLQLSQFQKKLKEYLLRLIHWN